MSPGRSIHFPVDVRGFVQPFLTPHVSNTVAWSMGKCFKLPHVAVGTNLVYTSDRAPWTKSLPQRVVGVVRNRTSTHARGVREHCSSKHNAGFVTWTWVISWHLPTWNRQMSQMMRAAGSYSTSSFCIDSLINTTGCLAGTPAIYKVLFPETCS